MTKTTAYDCDNCRECIYRRVFEEGIPWCAVTASYCPSNGCEFGSNKKAYHIDE